MCASSWPRCSHCITGARPQRCVWRHWVRSKAVERQSAGNKSAENHQDNRAPAAQQPTESFEITTRSVLKKIQLAVNLFRILPQAIYAYSKLTVD
jgi:hypothetical protein